jgi:Mu-like prophage I protein
MPNPGEYKNQDEWMSYCIPIQKGEGKEQDQAVAICTSMWKEHMKEKGMSADFVFVELSGVEAKAIDGLAVGKFVSMSGDEVEFSQDDLPAYIANTQAVIDSTKTEGGEIVGLPIDTQKHNHLGGAGWITGLELDKARNIIRFMVNWTEEGIRLIKNNLSRFFSPSVDIENKVIIGGSLTNYPATRSANGQLILRPIELSQTLKEIDMEKTIDEIVAEKVAAELAKQKPAEKKDEGDNPLLNEFINNPAEVEELSQQAQEMAQNIMQAEKRKSHVREFAARVSGGTKDRPVGLPGKASEIVKVLLSLPEKQALVIERWLEKILDGVVDFQSYGLDGSGSGYLPEMPKEIKELARTWVKSGKTIQSFFEVNPEIGEMNRYNLAEFMKKEE